jgi:hypothetical protein
MMTLSKRVKQFHPVLMQVMLAVAIFVECHYAECRRVERRGAIFTCCPFPPTMFAALVFLGKLSVMP